MAVPPIEAFPILMVIIAVPTSAAPVIRILKRVGTRTPPLIRIVVTVNGSVVCTRLVTFRKLARPNGPGTSEKVKMSGRAGTILTVLFISVPLLLITTGYSAPAPEAVKPGGTTKTISLWLTLFNPHAAPFIDNVTPLSCIGSVKLREMEPTAVRATTGGLSGAS